MPGLVIGVFIYMTISQVLQYLGLEIWRHDSFVHTLDATWYEGNVKEEGRWINYYVFDLIKLVPGHVAAIMNMLFTFVFGYLVVHSLTKDKYLAIIFGLAALQLPLLHAQNLWPVVTMLGFAALPAFFFLSKKVHPYIVFALAGIFYFGTLSHFYFLIPLIYLDRLNDHLKGKVKKDLISTGTKIIVPYCLFFIVGFLVANAVVALKTGGPITVADWRRPTPINGLDQFIANFSGLNERLFGFLSDFFSEGYLFIWVLIAGITLLAINRKSVWILVVLVVLVLSPFYTTLYHGILISDRTLMSGAIPLIAIFILLPALQFKFNFIHYILILAMMWPLCQVSNDQLRLFEKTTGYHKAQLVAALENSSMKNFQEVLLFIRNQEIANVNRQIRQHYGTEFKWGGTLDAVDRTVVTSFRSLGHYNVRWSNDEATINNVKKSINAGARSGNYIVFRINGRPNSIGVAMNNTDLDIQLLDGL